METDCGTPLTIHIPTDEINRILERKATVVPLSKFIIKTEATHTQAFTRALSFCKANGLSLFIEDGNYIVDSTVVINMQARGFAITGHSRDVVIRAKTNNAVFHVQSHRVRMNNISIVPFDDSYKYQYQAIQWDGAQGLCDNFYIRNANIGIVCDAECWCTNFTNINIAGANKGMVFKRSGGCLVQFDVLSGSAGYNNTQPNDSIGITFTKESGMQTLRDGGQIEAFHYAFDIHDVSHIVIGHIFIEHNLKTFTDTSKTDSLIAHSYYDVSNEQYNPNITKTTLNGVDKSSLFNNAKDSAIPLSEMTSYFLFDDKTGNLKDYSGSSATFNSNNLSLGEGIGLFGKQLKMVSSGNGSSGILTVPNLNYNKFTIVLSFNVDKINNMNVRTFELIAPDQKTFLLTNYGLSLSVYDGKTTLKLATLLRMEPDYNHFVAITFDTVTGEITAMTPEIKK